MALAVEWIQISRADGPYQQRTDRRFRDEDLEPEIFLRVRVQYLLSRTLEH